MASTAGWVGHLDGDHPTPSWLEGRARGGRPPVATTRKAERLAASPIIHRAAAASSGSVALAGAAALAARRLRSPSPWASSRRRGDGTTSGHGPSPHTPSDEGRSREAVPAQGRYPGARNRARPRPDGHARVVPRASAAARLGILHPAALPASSRLGRRCAKKKPDPRDRSRASSTLVLIATQAGGHVADPIDDAPHDGSRRLNRARRRLRRRY
jgi:hypothetical protein